jgi:hypothetical protein
MNIELKAAQIAAATARDSEANTASESHWMNLLCAAH